jgi:ribulose-bisphosphate carboxylase large chain
MWARHPALGVAFQPYAALWRLTGMDHMHVHGLDGKFAQDNQEVRDSARDCLTPLSDATDIGDVVMPAFSSGQWAGTLPQTLDAVPSGDLLFMCGGGILAHPQGPAAGVASVREAWAAWRGGTPLAQAAKHAPALRAALDFY